MSGIAPPNEMVQEDMRSFPTVDPKVTAQLAKQKADWDKAREKERKEEEASAKRAAALHGSAKKPAAKTAEVAKNEDGEDIRKLNLLNMKCHLYFKHFSDKLSIKEPKAYPKTVAGLQELLNAIQVELSSAGGIKNAAAIYQSGIEGAEQLTLRWNPLGLMLVGPATSFSQTIANNKKEWEDLVTEFAIEHAEWFMMSSFKRLVAFTLMTAQTVHKANVMAIVGMQQKQRAASDKMKEEASDL